MDDALLVRRFERLGDLPRDRQAPRRSASAARDPLREILALDQLHDEARMAPALLESVDRARCSDDSAAASALRFALEAGEAIGIAGEESRQDFERDVAIQPRVARAIDLAHAAGANGGDHFVLAERSSDWKAQMRSAGDAGL